MSKPLFKQGLGALTLLCLFVTFSPSYGALPGLNYSYFEKNNMTSVEQLPTTAKEIGTVANFNLNMSQVPDGFGIIFDGDLQIDTAGTYTFYLNSDDGSVLFIGNDLVVNNDGTHGVIEASGSISLAQGKHPIQVQYFENTQGESLLVEYAGPGISRQVIPDNKLSHAPRTSDSPNPTEYGLDYAYFEAPTFSSLADIPESAIDFGQVFNFTLSPKLRNDNFAFIYGGFISIPQAGDYTFYLNSDDGSALFIGDTLVINNDGSHAAQEIAGTIGLNTGLHAVQVQYFEATGGETLEVYIEGPTMPKQLIPDANLHRISSGINGFSGGGSASSQMAGAGYAGYNGATVNENSGVYTAAPGANSHYFVGEILPDQYQKLTITGEIKLAGGTKNLFLAVADSSAIANGQFVRGGLFLGRSDTGIDIFDTFSTKQTSSANSATYLENVFYPVKLSVDIPGNKVSVWFDNEPVLEKPLSDSPATFNLLDMMGVSSSGGTVEFRNMQVVDAESILIGAALNFDYVAYGEAAVSEVGTDGSGNTIYRADKTNSGFTSYSYLVAKTLPDAYDKLTVQGQVKFIEGTKVMALAIGDSSQVLDGIFVRGGIALGQDRLSLEFFNSTDPFNSSTNYNQNTDSSAAQHPYLENTYYDIKLTVDMLAGSATVYFADQAPYTIPLPTGSELSTLDMIGVSTRSATLEFKGLEIVESESVLAGSNPGGGSNNFVAYGEATVSENGTDGSGNTIYLTQKTSSGYTTYSYLVAKTLPDAYDVLTVEGEVKFLSGTKIMFLAIGDSAQIQNGAFARGGILIGQDRLGIEFFTPTDPFDSSINYNQSTDSSANQHPYVVGSYYNIKFTIDKLAGTATVYFADQPAYTVAISGASELSTLDMMGVSTRSADLEFKNLRVVDNESVISGQTSSLPLAERICLNDRWDFQPVSSYTASIPSGNWGKIYVPGAWRRGNPYYYASLPGIYQADSSWSWNPNTHNYAWYRYSLNIPASWAGNSVIIDFDRISTHSKVFVNGQEVGTTEWPGGSVDITSGLQSNDFGSTVDLYVLVKVDVSALDEFIQSQAPSRLSAGILGEVFMRCQPSGGHIDFIHVQTSRQNDEVTVALELDEIASSGSVNWKAEMINENGDVEKTFTKTTTLSSGQNTASLTWSWADPTLWEVGAPYMYTLRLTADGTPLRGIYTQTFGFREFYIQGRKFILNDHEIQLRPLEDRILAGNNGSVAIMTSALNSAMDAGANVIELWPRDQILEPGIPYTDPAIYMAADKVGIMTIGVAPHLKRFFTNNHLWKDGAEPVARKYYEQILKPLRNHPSIVMWTTTGNYWRDDDMSTPDLLGIVGANSTEYASDDSGVTDETWESWDERKLLWTNEVEPIFNAIDPSRVAMPHHANDVGDVTTVNMYLNMIPLQERDEWLSHWVENGDYPIMMTEFGTPYLATFGKGRISFVLATNTEPVATEYAAIYEGSDAYVNEDGAYRNWLSNPVNWVAHTDGKGQRFVSWGLKTEMRFSNSSQAVNDLFITSTWRNWRTWEISGGMVPWWNANGFDDSDLKGNVTINQAAYQPGQRGVYIEQDQEWKLDPVGPQGAVINAGGQALIDNNQPTLAWIAGPVESTDHTATVSDPGSFTSKERNFFAGSKLEKTVIILNDSRQNQSYTGSYTISVGSWSQSQNLSGNVSVSGQKRIQINQTLPSVGNITLGKIDLTVNIDGRTHTDTLDFHVYPMVSQFSGLDVAVFEPSTEKRSTHMLQTLGANVTFLSTDPAGSNWSNLSSFDLVVIGEKAYGTPGMSIGDAALANNLDTHVKAGGRVLILNQTRSFLENSMEFRISQFPERRFFKTRNPDMLNGIPDEAFWDWQGASTLVSPDYPDYSSIDGDDPLVQKTEYGNVYPRYGWHWGNRGSVASYAIEKPHRAGWTPLIEGGYDLAYTALMEMDYYGGRFILCVLDLEDRFVGSAGLLERDAAAVTVAKTIINYAANEPLRPQVAQKSKVAYVGGAIGDEIIDSNPYSPQAINQVYAETANWQSADVLLIGPEATLSQSAVKAFADSGKIAIYLARRDAGSSHGLTIAKPSTAQRGDYQSIPNWNMLDGVTASDLRWKASTSDTYLIQGGNSDFTVSAGGQLARHNNVSNNGEILVLQLDPYKFDTAFVKDSVIRDFTRAMAWRQSRALAQILSNAGVRLSGDRKLPTMSEFQDPYCGLWDGSWSTGDDPYRYDKW